MIRHRTAGNVLAPLLVAALLAACSHTNPSSLPPGPQLLQQSGQAMLISSAQGDVTSDGKANGSFVLGGTEFPFRLLKGTFYLKPPTGAWVSSPPPYDPAALLDKTNGLPSLLTKATGGQTQTTESAGGVDAYRVTASIPTELIKGLTDLAAGQDTLKATVWIATSDNRLVKFRIPYRAKDATEDTVLTGTITHFGVQVSVTPPV